MIQRVGYDADLHLAYRGSFKLRPEPGDSANFLSASAIFFLPYLSYYRGESVLGAVARISECGYPEG
jgi:hypothetical protein